MFTITPSPDPQHVFGIHLSHSLRHLVVVIALCCLTLTAIHPFMLGKLPLTADGELHLYRLISLDHAISQGNLWPRYVPGMVFGYGAPFFNYYSPLSLYPLEGFHLLGISFLNAWLLGFIFYTIVGIIGAYLFSSAWLGQTGGIIGAAAYTYAPYMLYDSLWRGTVAEFAALALLPWVFWGFWRLATYGRRRDLLAAVIPFVLFIPMHNITTLHSAILLMVYSAYLWWISDHKRRVFIHLAAGFVIALGLTAFFWLPALVETDYVKINSITANLPQIDVANNLRPLGDVFALPVTADPTQLQPPVSIALGWPQIILGAVALVLLARVQSDSDRKLRGWLWLSILLIAGLIFMNTPASAAIWKTIPFIRYSQFPWRLIGLASLLLAQLAGAGAVLIERRMRTTIQKYAWFVVCLGAMMIYAIPWLYSIYLPTPSANSIIDAQNFERETGWIATSSFGEYLPRWNQELPDSDRLAARFAETDSIPRLEPSPEIQIQSAQWGMTSGKLSLSAVSEAALVFDWFYFPGWRATLDGETLSLSPTVPEGLISAVIPPGDHDLEIHLGLTSTQNFAVVISVLACLGLIGILVLPPYPKMIPGQIVGTSSNFLFAVISVGIVLFAAKVLIVDNAQTVLKQERFADGIESGLQVPLLTNFDNQLMLLGYDLPESQVQSGKLVPIRLYWQLMGNCIDADYSSLIYLKDSAGNVIIESGSFYPGGLATSNWLPGYYIQERLDLEIPPGTPPGVYSIDVSLFSADNQRSLDVINSQGNPEDVKIRIGQLFVSYPDTRVNPDDLEIEQKLSADLNNELRLIGTASILTDAEVGQELTLEWYWQALAQLGKNYVVRVLWLTDRGEVAAASPDMPLVIGYPTSQWQQGDVWRGLHTVYVPGRLETGSYRVAIQLVDEELKEPVGERVMLGEMQVDAPVRVFTLPEMSHLVDVAWANGITLKGYDLSQAGDLLHLVLYWQVQEDLFTSLRVFVHLVDEQGLIVSQSDGIPVDWTRPTTGWAPGEVVVDSINLTMRINMAPGQYSLVVGWYDPITRQRIPLGDQDFWTFPEPITIGE